MAVVQISRIQVRRGQKNQGTGIPQLASGELGWAVDTRELFIGNGSVAEGAPQVGNTKILTEFDDLFTLADTYTYRSPDSYIVTGPNSSNPIKRTLQARLDDRVSVRSFGAKGDNSTADLASLQRAIDQNYINSATSGNPQSRVVLHIEPGTYLINGTIYLPPFTTIVGAGKGKTIIKQTGTGPIFQTVNGSSLPGAPASDASSTTLTQARNILIKGMTLETTAAGKAMVLQSCKDSTFDDVEIKGIWTNSDTISSSDIAIEMNSLSGTVESSNNNFINCKITGYSYAVVSNWDIENNKWFDCEFDTLGYGFVFGQNMILGTAASGQSVGPSSNVIESSRFSNINRHGIWVVNGVENVSKSNNFALVGNNNQTEKDPSYSVIKFEKNKNKSFNDVFARTPALSFGSGLTNVVYVPEIEGTAFYELNFENNITFGQISNQRLFRLPGVINQGYEVDYIMVSETYRVIRNGTLHVVVDAYGNNVEISDEFHFVGDESYLDDIEFNVALLDNDADLTSDTIDVKVTSTMPVDDQTQFKYTVKAKKTNVI